MSPLESVNVLGGVSALGCRISNAMQLADAVEQGLPKDTLQNVKEAFDISDEQLGKLLGVSHKTLARLRQQAGARLTAVCSDRLVRIARIFSLAKQTLESEDAARDWLKTPQIGLNQRAPLDVMRTGVGAREVESLLGRLEYGVYV